MLVTYLKFIDKLNLLPFTPKKVKFQMYMDQYGKCLAYVYALKYCYVMHTTIMYNTWYLKKKKLTRIESVFNNVLLINDLSIYL